MGRGARWFSYGWNDGLAHVRRMSAAGNASISLWFHSYITYSKGTQWPRVSLVFLFVHPLESSHVMHLFGALPLNHLIDFIQVSAHPCTVNPYSIG